MGEVLRTAYGLLRAVPAVVSGRAVERGGWYALRTAIEGGDLRALEKFASKKKWPRCEEHPLLLAARLGRTSLVRRLVEDADLAPVGELASALTTAAGTGNVELVSLLVEAIFTRTGEHSRRSQRALGDALQAAASTGQLGVCRLVLDKGADVDHRSGPQDYTSLMRSIMNGHLEITRELVERGADVDAVAVNDDCPVEMAGTEGDQESLKILLEAGASVDLPGTPFADGAPINAMDLALVCSPRIVEYLQSRGITAKRTRPA